MRQIFTIIASTVSALLIFFGVIWVFKANILAHYLSRSLHNAPVSIDSIGYKEDVFTVNRLSISTIAEPQKTAFFTKTLSVYANWKQLFKRPIVIDAIQAKDVYIHITLYKDGSSNWSKILGKKESQSKNGAAYLIKQLSLKNLQVTVASSGKVKTYPIIDEITLYNISNETGFPIHEVEKAIFRLVLKKLFDDFGIKTIEKILDRVLPINGKIPLFGN